MPPRRFETLTSVPRPPSVPLPPGEFKLRRYEPPALVTREIKQLVASEKEDFQRRLTEWGRGSNLEFICWEYLTKRRHLVEGVDFLFQSSKFGGRRIFGGIVVDFYIFTRDLVWQPQGEYFHLRTPQQRAKLVIERLLLTQRGLKVVYLWERDLLSRPTFVLDKAWNGEQLRKGIGEG